MNKAFETPVETKPEGRRYDNRNHQKQEKQYKDADITKLKNKPGRFIRPETRPAAKKEETAAAGEHQHFRSGRTHEDPAVRHYQETVFSRKDADCELGAGL